MDAHISNATKITQKYPKETTKARGISLTIMGQESIYNSTHKPQRSPNETIGFTHDDHDRIPSTTPGAEPPRDAKDSGSARSHPMHLETSSSNRP